jgi:hypothetical protein
MQFQYGKAIFMFDMAILSIPKALAWGHENLESLSEEGQKHLKISAPLPVRAC